MSLTVSSSSCLLKNCHVCIFFRKYNLTPQGLNKRFASVNKVERRHRTQLGKIIKTDTERTQPQREPMRRRESSRLQLDSENTDQESETITDRLRRQLQGIANRGKKKRGRPPSIHKPPNDNILWTDKSYYVPSADEIPSALPKEAPPKNPDTLLGKLSHFPLSRVTEPSYDVYINNHLD